MNTDTMSASPLVRKALEILARLPERDNIGPPAARTLEVERGTERGLAFRCSGCGLLVTQLHRIGRCWRCLDCASLPSGARVWWQRMNGDQCGPVTVERVVVDETGRLWVRVFSHGSEELFSELLITKIKHGDPVGSS